MQGADPLTEQIIASAIEVHRILGRGLLESIYRQALAHEFTLRGIPYQEEKPVDVVYKRAVIKGQKIDLVAFLKIL